MGRVTFEWDGIGIFPHSADQRSDWSAADGRIFPPTSCAAVKGRFVELLWTLVKHVTAAMARW